MTEQRVADVLPLRPADAQKGTGAGANADHAPAREESHGVPLWMRVQLMFAGASVIESPPPSLGLVWARHMQSARFYRSWWARWPAWAYGALHTCLLAAPAYLLVWATDSRPKLAATALVATAMLWLLHVI